MTICPGGHAHQAWRPENCSATANIAHQSQGRPCALPACTALQQYPEAEVSHQSRFPTVMRPPVIAKDVGGIVLTKQGGFPVGYAPNHVAKLKPAHSLSRFRRPTSTSHQKQFEALQLPSTRIIALDSVFPSKSHLLLNKGRNHARIRSSCQQSCGLPNAVRLQCKPSRMRSQSCCCSL